MGFLSSFKKLFGKRKIQAKKNVDGEHKSTDVRGKGKAEAAEDEVGTQGSPIYQDEERDIVENEHKEHDSEHDSVRASDDGDSDGDADYDNNAADMSNDEDDNGFIGEFEDELATSKSFSCLSPSDIVAYQESEVRAIADLLSIPHSVSATLLRHFQWKREKLLTRYLENPQQTCSDAGVQHIPQNIPPISSSSSVNSAAKRRSDTLQRNNTAQSGMNAAQSSVNTAQLGITGACSICGEDDLTSSASLTCRHVFCNDCWENHLTTKVNCGEPEIRCPQWKCNTRVDDAFVKRMVPQPIFEKYLRFVTKNFVQENDRVRWCPTPGCNNAITFDQANSTSDSMVVQCACGFCFCFRCHREAHAPSSCDQMKSWEQKCQDDSETFNWKSVNCRECPKCDVAVEKNGGCNHMTCRQCKYEWCWVCMRAWKGHNDFYSCNRFEKELADQQKGKKKKSKKKKAEDEKEKKRQALERYLHYYERYVNHDNSRKLEKELRTSAMSKMKELQDGDATRAQVKFLEKAVNELQECRSVLKYTYVFSFYFFEEGKQFAVFAKQLFEDLQEDLEKTTERLSEVIENFLKRNEIEMSPKLEAINHTDLAKTKRENLLTALARDPLFEQSN